MSERVGDEGRERVRESKREGGKRTTLQTLAHCHCSTARGQRQRRKQWKRIGWRKKTEPSVCSSVPVTESLPLGPSGQVGSKTGGKKGENYSLCPSQDQVPDFNSCRTDNTTQTHTSLFLPSLTYSHPHSLELKHISLLVAFWTFFFFFSTLPFADLLS